MRYLLLLCSLMFGLSAFAAEPEFPKLSGRVVDNAQLLSAATTQNLNKQLAAQEQRTGNQLVVVTLNDLQGYDIADFGFQLGRHWGIGQKDTNNGALLIIAKQERKMRIEVGYGLEGKLTDARSAQIIQQILSPAFKTGDFNGGVTRAVEAMISLIDGNAVAVPKKQSSNKESPPALGFLMFIAIIFMMMGGGRGRGRSGLLGGLLLGSALGRGGSGGFGGGGFGGGGFGGGGGGFGGGGASGGW